METIEELKKQLQEVIKDKIKRAAEGMYQWSAKLRDLEKSLIKQIEELKNKESWGIDTTTTAKGVFEEWHYSMDKNLYFEERYLCKN